MTQRPTREEVRNLIQKIQARTETLTKGRADFAVTAILCQVNEGIEPSITGKLRFQDFDLGERWVEFRPYHRPYVVRRALSEETRAHITAQAVKLEAKPADLIHRHVPVSHFHPQKYKDGELWREPNSFNRALAQEVHMAGCDPKKFSPVALKWVWVDEHPHLREEEVRANILADFVLECAKSQQQEALLRRVYKNTPVLRPSWAYPEWHKDAKATSVPQEIAA